MGITGSLFIRHEPERKNNNLTPCDVYVLSTNEAHWLKYVPHQAFVWFYTPSGVNRVLTDFKYFVFSDTLLG